MSWCGSEGTSFLETKWTSGCFHAPSTCVAELCLTRWQSCVLTVAPSLRWQLRRRCRSPCPQVALASSWHPLQPVDTEQRVQCCRSWLSRLTSFYSTCGLRLLRAALPHIKTSQTKEQPTQKKAALKNWASLWGEATRFALRCPLNETSTSECTENC